MKLGLLGRKLGHSYSPAIHGMLGDPDYRLFEVEPEDLARFLRFGDFDGINVTIPYKKDVVRYLDRVDETARRLGNVNTVVREPDGTLSGHNTDHFGFSRLLADSGLSVSGKKVLVLGTGGASRTVCAVLADQGAKTVQISRTGENNYQNLDRHRDAAVIVNATPVGMFPQVDQAAVDVSEFPALEGVFDLIYNPARTKLMLQCEALGIPCWNGLKMLAAQAVQASEFFHRSSIDPARTDEIHRALRRQMENILLIGMPGCGKSTIGALLAQKLGRRFVDSDAEIEKAAGCSIPELFARDGEEGFRALETRVLAELGKQSALVIATGGGCVTRPENSPHLHRNSTVLWIKRELSRLPTQGRPLSEKSGIQALYDLRRPLYETASDASLENSGTPEEACEKILALLEELP